MNTLIAYKNSFKKKNWDEEHREGTTFFICFERKFIAINIIMLCTYRFYQKNAMYI